MCIGMEYYLTCLIRNSRKNLKRRIIIKITRLGWWGNDDVMVMLSMYFCKSYGQ